jgi:hypothetical protein
MTTKFKIGLGGLLLTLTVFYFYNEDSLPPRTPRKIARLISGLSISRETKLEKSIDIWAPNGDGEVLVKGILTDQELSDLIEDAKMKDFKTLPIRVNLGSATIDDDLFERGNGFYKIEIDKDDPRDYYLTIIDVDKKELITYLSVL